MKEEELKLLFVIVFDVVEIRECDWCNIVICYMDEVVVYLW